VCVCVVHAVGQVILPSGALLIRRVIGRDQGVYRCVAVNPVTRLQRTSPTVVRLRISRTGQSRDLDVNSGPTVIQDSRLA